MAKLKAIDWNPSATAAENARLFLPVLAEEYFSAGRKLLGKKRTLDEMHRFRLKTKRFRYTLELFKDVYGKSLDRWLELLRPVQSALGEISDCAATLELLKEGRTGKRQNASEKAVGEYLRKRSVQKNREFTELWRHHFDAPGQSKRWIDYLARTPVGEKLRLRDSLAARSRPA